MSVLREFIGPFMQLCERYLGIKIDPLWGEVLVALSVIVVFSFALHNTYLWARRRLFGDMSALPEEQLAMVTLIAMDVKGIKSHVEQAISGLHTSIGGQLEEKLSKLKEFENDNDQLPENELPAGPKALRLYIADQVKSAVMEKFIEGRVFKEWQHHVFRFEGVMQDGSSVFMQLQTPYRTWNRDEHYDYVLEIRVATKKVLNLEWAADEDLWVRHLRTGPWVEQVASWTLIAEQSATVQAAQ